MVTHISVKFSFFNDVKASPLKVTITPVFAASPSNSTRDTTQASKPNFIRFTEKKMWNVIIWSPLLHQDHICTEYEVMNFKFKLGFSGDHSRKVLKIMDFFSFFYQEILFRWDIFHQINNFFIIWFQMPSTIKETSMALTI